MPDTILIDGFEDDDIEVMDKFDLDEHVSEDVLKDTAEMFMDEMLMDEAADGKYETPIYSIARVLFTAELDARLQKTAETIVDIPKALSLDDIVGEDGSGLAKMMDTLTREE
jgi:hypothetical protein